VSILTIHRQFDMSCQVMVMKIIDRFFGNVATRLLPSPKLKLPVIPQRILIIRPGGIGDAVLLAPAINFLKKLYPDCHVTILAERRNAGVFPLISGVTKVLCYDRPHELIQTLRDRYDVVIDTEQWYRLSAVVARLVRAPVKIGFDTNVRRRMFTHGIHYDLAVYEAENFLTMLKPLGGDFQLDVNLVSLSIPHRAMTRACQLLQYIGSNPFVVIFAGASIEEKRWGRERFSLVAKQMAEDGYRVVVVGGREDHSDGEIIADAGGGVNLAGITNLAETAAVISRSSLVISGDSGVLHIAVGLGVQTVSLFGPGSATKWAPKGERHIVINRMLPCSPCSKFGSMPTCQNDAKCIQSITVDDVANAVNMLLSCTRTNRSRC